MADRNPIFDASRGHATKLRRPRNLNACYIKSSAKTFHHCYGKLLVGRKL